MHLKKKIASIYTKFKGKVYDIKQFLRTNDVELTMLIGIFFISFATYKVDFIAFLYVLGFIFIILSVFLLKFPRGR